MSIKNILTLSFVFGLLVLSGLAALIVNPLWWCPAVGVAMHVPEALEQID